MLLKIIGDTKQCTLNLCFTVHSHQNFLIYISSQYAIDTGKFAQVYYIVHNHPNIL